MTDRLSDIQKVMRINRHAIGPTGALRSVAEQIADYALSRELDGPEAAAREFMPIVLVQNCDVFNIPALEGRPLVLFHHAIKHIERKHHGNINDLADLARELHENLVAYQDPKRDDHYVFVLESISKDGNRIIAALEAEAQADSVVVNKVSSVHGKRDLASHILKAIDLGRDVFVNERTGTWLGFEREWQSDEADALTNEAHRCLSELYYSKFPVEATLRGLAPEGIYSRAKEEIEASGVWNLYTGEAIFADTDFDKADGYGTTWLDMHEIALVIDVPGNFKSPWDGYSPDRDDDILRAEAIRRVATEPGWIRAGRFDDDVLQEIWDSHLCDAPFYEGLDGELYLERDFFVFEVGTSRDEIWHWFDAHHTKGVAYLMGAAPGRLGDVMAEELGQEPETRDQERGRGLEDRQ